MVGAAQQEIRSPDFLPEFRESANFMRLSLKENRTRGHLSAPRSRKSGPGISCRSFASQQTSCGFP
jgi:hypothetical protein